ncbi:hypothetical protein D7B24_008201 [Verticillium nonalfalfae]|uniref:Zn(2)-C6 fungal-type domain-containing protein n=1 Tax=Verticillium nonalfalfae TaxID=1051616 RepID=A0A3M9Y5J9_9PEZI|nr:uncharacterized protein D7B24_008201 [Verticillium nonalfalfae]RNJ55773.1 hypothetical protein D7B24_008201 [Verticillium nonalfalfae]
MAAGEGMETTDRCSKPLACTHCNARFSRPSHLNRHRLTHLPSSRKSLIKCPHCDRTFSRNDVLLRHLRGAHHVDLVVKRSVQRSCHRCVSKKLKCDRLQPCQSCTGAQAICEFPGASHSRSSDLESEALYALDSNEHAEATGVAGFSPFDPSFESTDIPQTPQILQTPDSTLGNSLFPATYLGTQRHADDLDNDPAVSSVEGFGQADDAIFGVNALEPGGAGISPSHLALMQPDFRMIGFDWLDFDMPESNPGILIGSLRGMGLLSSRWSVGEDVGHEASLATDPKHADQEWSAWSLHAHKPPGCPGHAFPSHLGTWAKRLCGQVIGRLLWDLKQLEIVAMPEHFGLTSLLSAHQQSKQSLLGALQKLLESMDTVSTTSELISYNITGLLCHYSHLYAANDVMDVILYIVRSLISQRAKHHKGIEVARKRLRSSFAQDRRSSRRLVHHAAQIIAIANEYLVSAPCEIMRTFMGYVFILAYSSYGPRAELMSGDKAPIRLDVPLHQPAQQQITLQWIEDGGPAGLGSVVNILADDCVPAISRDAQMMMQRLKCWGLADKFTKILHIFEVNGF